MPATGGRRRGCVGEGGVAVQRQTTSPGRSVGRIAGLKARASRKGTGTAAVRGSVAIPGGLLMPGGTCHDQSVARDRLRCVARRGADRNGP
jgi:hypothetical protein